MPPQISNRAIFREDDLEVEFKLFRHSAHDYRLLLNGEAYSDIRFPVSFPVNYGYEAETIDGECYELKSKGLFVWRKPRLYKNGLECGRFTSCSTLISGKRLYRGRLNSIYYDGKLVARVDFFNLSVIEKGIVYDWSCEDANFAWPIITLLLVSLQGRATTPVSAIP